MFAILSFDEFKESEHPRDTDGKFSNSGSGGVGSSASKKKWHPNDQVVKVLKTGGFKKVHGTIDTFISPEGVKVIFHPPTDGKNSSSKWTSHKEGKPDKFGSGKSIAQLLRIATEQAVKKKAEEAAAAPSANVKSSLEKLGYKEASKYGSKAIFTNGAAKVEYDSDDDSWVAATPGHFTKEGSGIENLKKLLSGEPVAFAYGEVPPWKNSYKTIQTPEDKTAVALKKAKAKENDDLFHDITSHAPEATISERNALSYYTSTGYADLNDALRHGKESESIEAKAKEIDSYLKKATIPKDISVYRGVKGEFAKILKSVLMEGTKFVDKGFISTSFSEGIASNFQSGLKMKINVKAGSSGASLHNFSQHKQEKEVLLPRNSAFIVKSYDPKSGFIEVDLDQGHLK